MPTYPGGKNGAGVYQTIINQMPPHSLYIEAFLGSGAILRAKKPAPAGSIAIDSDPEVIARFGDSAGVTVVCSDAAPPGLTVICGDAISWLEEQAAVNAIPDDALIYCDPPYLMETRRSQRPLYTHEMTMLQHRDFLRCVRALRCRVIISGYWSGLYAAELQDWRTITFQTRTRGGTPATEWLWMNYPEPFELHDYRYLGSNFRERERLKRRKTRWLNRLQRMSDLERYAMLDAISSIARNDDTAPASPRLAMAAGIAQNGDTGQPRQ